MYVAQEIFATSNKEGYCQGWVKTKLTPQNTRSQINSMQAPHMNFKIKGIKVLLIFIKNKFSHFTQGQYDSSFPSTASSTSRKRRSSPWRTATRCNGGCGCFGCVHVSLFLGLDNVLLVPNPFVAKPVAHLIKNRFFVKTIF